MHLSKRMKMVAELADYGLTIADVGCDHAYLSIYLVGQKNAPHAVAMDINKGPLARAAENIKKYGLTERIETRLSNGLNMLKPLEAELIIAAGMGGALMANILSEGKECVDAAKELVLQPQSEIFKVRQYIEKAGYIIAAESMCVDDGKYYTAIKAVNKKAMLKEDIKKSNIYEDNYLYKDNDIIRAAWYTYGKCLLEENNEILLEYMLKEKLKLNNIISELCSENTERAKTRLSECKAKLEVINEALKKYYIY